MWYAGPRMLHRHLILTLFHLIDGLRKEPVGPQRKIGNSWGASVRGHLSPAVCLGWVAGFVTMEYNRIRWWCELREDPIVYTKLWEVINKKEISKCFPNLFYL
jgi:hypothetical protein